MGLQTWCIAVLHYSSPTARILRPILKARTVWARTAQEHVADAGKASASGEAGHHVGHVHRLALIRRICVPVCMYHPGSSSRNQYTANEPAE